MAKFQIEWDNGVVEIVEQSDCHSIEQYMNCRFGAGKEVPAKVVLLGNEEPVAKKVTKK